MMFRLNTQQNTTLNEKIKWLLIVALACAGVALNYYFESYSLILKIVGWLCLLSLIFGFFVTTNQGKSLLSFVRESRIELRKVFWPTRQETLQVTFFVAVMVLILALILWGMDSFLVWLLGWLTGQRG